VTLLVWSVQALLRELGRRGLTVEVALLVLATASVLALELVTGKGAEYLALVVATREAAKVAMQVEVKSGREKYSGSVKDGGKVVRDGSEWVSGLDSESVAGMEPDEGKELALGTGWEPSSAKAKEPQGGKEQAYVEKLDEVPGSE
jgi:hypothetical protein